MDRMIKAAIYADGSTFGEDQNHLEENNMKPINPFCSQANFLNL